MPCGRLEKVEQRPNFASFSAHFHDTIFNKESMKYQNTRIERGLLL